MPDSVITLKTVNSHRTNYGIYNRVEADSKRYLDNSTYPLPSVMLLEPSSPSFNETSDPEPIPQANTVTMEESPSFNWSDEPIPEHSSQPLPPMARDFSGLRSTPIGKSLSAWNSIQRRKHRRPPKASQLSQVIEIAASNIHASLPKINTPGSWLFIPSGLRLIVLQSGS